MHGVTRRRAAGRAAAAEAAAREGELRARVQDFARRVELLQVLLSSLLPATLDDLASDNQARAGCLTVITVFFMCACGLLDRRPKVRPNVARVAVGLHVLISPPSMA